MRMRRSRELPAILALAFLAWASFLTQVLARGDTPPPKDPASVVDPSMGIDELTLRLAPLSREELGAVAESWFEIVKSKTEEVVEAQLAVANEAGTTAEGAREKLLELTAERNALFDRFATVLSSWEKKEGDPDRISEYIAYKKAVIVEQTRMTDFRTLAEQARKWALSTDGGIRFLIKILILVVALLGLATVARLARRFTRRAAGRSPNISKLLQAFLALAVYWIVFAIGLMIVLSAVGVDISPLFALIGGASFILAFALQSTLGNLAAGLMIMISRPFDEGDFVDLGGVAGTVKTVSIVSTKVITPDNQVIIVPNSNVWGNVIRNVTASPTRRVDLTFGIGYDDSIETAQGVLEKTVKEHPLVLKDPAPVIRVGELGESSVNLVVRPWVKVEDYWTVYWDLTRQVKEAFDSNGISIPFPQRDVHMRNTAQPSEKSSETNADTTS